MHYAIIKLIIVYIIFVCYYSMMVHMLNRVSWTTSPTILADIEEEKSCL